MEGHHHIPGFAHIAKPPLPRRGGKEVGWLTILNRQLRLFELALVTCRHRPRRFAGVPMDLRGLPMNTVG